ncbi:hypothetical protein [Streptomyces violascens]|uniref:hypothetical protein n=1 Tax=Streptomyces violascens TaxID=67381 RepID=UPI00368ED176
MPDAASTAGDLQEQRLGEMCGEVDPAVVQLGSEFGGGLRSTGFLPRQRARIGTRAAGTPVKSGSA